MNLLFRVVFATVARSTHHKIALDALRYIRGGSCERWQRLFIKHHRLYLEGSKVPDTEFRDFRNHVLHVRDGNWGGAPKAAERWYRQLVLDLQARSWPQAVFDAGVLSHYYSDPIQPFHTAQSDEESRIHRAAEWSISQAYNPIRQVLVRQVGLPAIEVPAGNDWLQKMVIAGAEAANPHYETLIAHYDFDRGVKDPPAGLDGVSRKILAQLIGHAAVGFARILERAFADSGVDPPGAHLGLSTLMTSLKVPAHWIMGKLHDARDRRAVEAIYQELQATGRVERTLPEDDRVVRQLHAQEVLAKQAAIQPSAARPAAAPDRAGRLVTESAPSLPNRSVASQRPEALRFYLEESDRIVAAPSIGPKTASRLARIGVNTVADLLRLDAEKAARQMAVRYLTAATFRDWQDQAKLVCQVPNLRGHDAQILVGCHVRCPTQLAGSDVDGLLASVLAFVSTREGRRILRGGKQPDAVEVADWIRWAAHRRQLAA